MCLVDLLYSVTTGPERRRRLLTPVALAIVIGFFCLMVFGSLFTDRAFGLPPLLPGRLGLAVGIPLFAAGLSFHASCVFLFKRARGGGGIGVPCNPPRELVVVGPYAWVRNPMLAGWFVWQIGLGLMLHSISMVFLCTPLFIAMNVLELKLVEEPELERRFGASYNQYRARVPMFIPRRPPRSM